MPKTTTNKKTARDYRHEDQKALLRPESGAQDVFPAGKKKLRREYRYDSSLAPQLAWDEAEARSQGEALIKEILESKDLTQAQSAAEKLQRLSQPFLNWAGKAERERISIPTLPLFVHERLSTAAVLKTLEHHRRNRSETLDLFGESNKSIGEKIRGAYEHKNGWQNRLILGDSLQVMNSLLEYESLGRQVQMVYMDPPYGVKFGSNFQPFVRKRDTKHGGDEGYSREPEMVKAYRDTWELGVHSWLTYMRDRLLLARELLTDSGSCFVQISDENVHLVRGIMDEIFGRENFIRQITFLKTTGKAGKFLDETADYLLWYGKNSDNTKFVQVHKEKEYGARGAKEYRFLMFGDRKWREIKNEEFLDTTMLRKKGKIFSHDNFTAQSGSISTIFDFELDGEIISAPTHGGWKTNAEGVENLKKGNRLIRIGNSPRYVRFFDDFPIYPITGHWVDTIISGFGEKKSYVVQTMEKVIQRCILMTTDPGDLVFDPTCGSGTTAVAAEQWGRRWITTDVSRVPLALARQRLLTATYPYYQLKNTDRGPGGGFVYARKKNKKGEEVGGIVPHITLKSIANNEPSAEEVLVDKPETERDTIRITGPFCVEAVLPTPLSPESPHSTSRDQAKDEISESLGDQEEDHIPRMIRVLRLSPVLNLPNNKKFRLQNIHPPANSFALHAEGENTDTGDSVAIVFGPANGAISEHTVVEAGKEARHKSHSLLLVIAFAIEPAARQTIELGKETFGLPALYTQASPDLTMSDLLKNTISSQIFSVVGLPDVKLCKAQKKADDGSDLWTVTLNGLDTFDPTNMEPKSLQGDDVPCWMLDPDYDGQCFRAGQVFFPRTAAWESIRKAVQIDFEDSVWEHLRGATSAPFAAGKQIAVKVIDDRGNELMVVKRLNEHS